jgi:hypothetical protein
MNKFTRAIESTLLKNKIDLLAKKLRASQADKNASTLEQQIAEATNLLSSFYRGLGQPIFNPSEIQPGSLPNLDEYNRGVEGLSDDLSIIFNELENIEGLVLQNFNYFISESNRLNRKTKSISSKLGDYVLYAGSTLKDTLFFTDSFNNLNNIETDPAFLRGDQCEINQAEGILTLPITPDSHSSIKITTLPTINSNSNGVAGNNQEVGALQNSDLKKILDNNPDTWFEYERVVEPHKDDGTPLILDLRLDLGSDQIVNFVRINPNNFGTKTQVEILDVSTSLDGASFISIKDEIPVPGFSTIDEPNIFTLAPSTSKYAGQGVFTFTPRTARYLHLTLRQSTPYLINTLLGPRDRYAIGIRDIELQAQRYKDTGEVVSREFVSSDEIRKVLLLSSQSPSEESELVSISHQVSPDNGNTWIDIRPKEFTGLTDTVNQVPEVITFNTGLDGATTTNSPVLRVRYKATLKRNTAAFTSGAPGLKQITRQTTELHQLPATTPFSIQLDRAPVPESVQVVDPQFGSRGLDDYRYSIALGGQTAQNYYLPWKDIPLNKSKTLSGGQWLITETNSAKVYVNGEQWTAANLSTAVANDKVYSIDYNRGILRFGDGRRGRAPEQGAIISLSFTPERILTVPSQDGHIAKLSFPTNGDQRAMTIKRYGATQHSTEALDKFARVFRLKNKNLVPGTVAFKPTAGSFASEKTFIDGSVELTATGHYSIDYESGILYAFTATGAVTEVTISYKYTPIEILDLTDWVFTDSDALKDEILIKNSGWGTINISGEAIPSAVQKFSLSQFNIEPGTIKFSDSTVFSREVPFIDGRTEILGLIKASEIIPSGILDQGSFPGVKTFNTSLIPADTSNHIVSFSNTTVFTTQVSGTPVAPGEYQVVPSTRTVNVYVSSAVTNPGTIAYFYQDPTKNLSGIYSVDYKSGTVYTHDNTLSSTIADYQYSYLEASYPIARVIPVEDFEVDTANKQVRISDREVLRKIQIPGIAPRVAANAYQVLYHYIQESRSGLDQLEPYFTPILKEYVLRVLTKGNIF